MEDTVKRLDIKAVLEDKDGDSAPKRGAKVGEWSDDELIVRTFPLKELMDRIIYIGYDFSRAKPMEKKIRKVLPDIIKKDRNYAMATIDILSDKTIDKSEIADMIDANVDEFLETHKQKLLTFQNYKRPAQ